MTPVEKVRMPVGIFRWKLEKEGYETVLAADSTWAIPNSKGSLDIIPYDLVRNLDEEGSLPPGMERVPATQTPIGTLDDFFIGRYEVTNREYKAFVDAGGYRNRDYWKCPFMEDGRGLPGSRPSLRWWILRASPAPLTGWRETIPKGRGSSRAGSLHQLWRLGHS